MLQVVQVLQGRSTPYLPIPGKFLRFLPTVLLRCGLPLNQSLWRGEGAYTDDEANQDLLPELGLKPVPRNHMGEDDEEACSLVGNSEHCYQEAEGNECWAANSRCVQSTFLSVVVRIKCANERKAFNTVIGTSEVPS